MKQMKKNRYVLKSILKIFIEIQTKEGIHKAFFVPSEIKNIFNIY